MNILELIEKRRIELTPEYEGGWHANIYDDEDTHTYSGYGQTVELAIIDALRDEEIYNDHLQSLSKQQIHNNPSSTYTH